MEIILATHNLHKVREFRELFKLLKRPYELLSLMQYPQYALPEETGKTFQENAELKASHAAKTLGVNVLADDSGLIVPTLGGAPGVYSRRYAGSEATDSENRQKLLKELEGKQEWERVAYFECCLVLATPEGIVKCVQGICEGAIAEKERGNHGFGYDPLFIKNDSHKTFAEISETVKNRTSHRRKAFEKLIPFLERPW